MAKTPNSGKVRIIGGQWRGRKLSVADVPGLRPSGDRLRETVFNWLQWSLPGSRCLDLFAGSGALGLEAASRGAASVTLVESSPQAIKNLRNHIDMLDGEGKVRLEATPAQTFLASNNQQFDIVFVDPPFEANLHAQILESLSHGTLSASAQVYVEAPSTLDINSVIDEQFTVSKKGKFGDVQACLLTQLSDN